MTTVTKDKGLLEKLQRRLGDTVPSTDTLMLAIAKAPKPVVHTKYVRSILAEKIIKDKASLHPSSLPWFYLFYTVWL